MKLDKREFVLMLRELKRRGLTHKAAYTLMSLKMWGIGQSLLLWKLGLSEKWFVEVYRKTIYGDID